MKGKIILLLALAAGLYLVYSFFFSGTFEEGLAELRALEEKNNAKEAFLVPVTEQEIKNYKAGLSPLRTKYSQNTALKNVFEIKLSLALIQEDLLNAADSFGTANKFNPDCSSGSKMFKARESAQSALEKTDLVLAKRNAFVKNFPKESILVQEIFGAGFENSLTAVKSGVMQLEKIVSNYC